MIWPLQRILSFFLFVMELEEFWNSRLQQLDAQKIRSWSFSWNRDKNKSLSNVCLSAAVKGKSYCGRLKTLVTLHVKSGAGLSSLAVLPSPIPPQNFSYELHCEKVQKWMALWKTKFKMDRFLFVCVYVCVLGGSNSHWWRGLLKYSALRIMSPFQSNVISYSLLQIYPGENWGEKKASPCV